VTILATDSVGQLVFDVGIEERAVSDLLKQLEGVHALKDLHLTQADVSSG
jgi:hypothetical protein